MVNKTNDTLMNNFEEYTDDLDTRSDGDDFFKCFLFLNFVCHLITLTISLGEFCLIFILNLKLILLSKVG